MEEQDADGFPHQPGMDLAGDFLEDMRGPFGNLADRLLANGTNEHVDLNHLDGIRSDDDLQSLIQSVISQRNSNSFAYP